MFLGHRKPRILRDYFVRWKPVVRILIRIVWYGVLVQFYGCLRPKRDVIRCSLFVGS